MASCPPTYKQTKSFHLEPDNQWARAASPHLSQFSSRPVESCIVRGRNGIGWGPPTRIRNRDPALLTMTVLSGLEKAHASLAGSCPPWRMGAPIGMRSVLLPRPARHYGKMDSLVVLVLEAPALSHPSPLPVIWSRGSRRRPLSVTTPPPPVRVTCDL